MLPTRAAWETRLDWTLTAVHWSGLTLAVIFSAASEGMTGDVAVASVVAGGYVVAMQVIPRSLRDTELIGELLAVIGVIASLVAVALTGGIDSPFVLFLAVPAFFAAAFLGFRIGLETAVLSAAGLAVVVATLDQEVLQGQVAQAMFLYVLIAITLSQARRILIEERARSDALAEASELAALRMERLEAAHHLLTSLSELANVDELNPVTVGGAALRDLARIVPFRAGNVVLTGDDGDSLVVARRGEVVLDEDPAVFPMKVRDRALGRLELWAGPDNDLQRSAALIEEALRPVSLAFDNILLLQGIAHRAVHQERTRLARELHDEIGPALASLGLRMDMTIHTATDDPDLIRYLEGMRRSITTLVEDVRRTVADLRHDDVPSVVEQAHRIAADLGPDAPAIIIDINERRPPRPVVTVELTAILTEAVRNAVDHAAATTIRIDGYSDRDHGKLVVSDDGTGFDPSLQPKGHFGLVGMQERAAEIGARLTIDAAPGRGCRITIEWEGDE